MSIKDRIKDVSDRFEGCGEDWERRYKLLIEMGKELPVLNKEYKSEANLIRGCQSQVWLQANFDGNQIVFLTESDAAITRGIAALLVNVYSESTPDEILATKPDFLEKIGIREHLSMNRANGLAAMLKQITIYAMAFKAKGNM